MPVNHLKETPSQTAGPYVHIGTVPSAAGLPLRTQGKLNVMAGAETPHVTLFVFARGINIHLHTRVYFSDEAEANEKDRVLRSIEHRNRVKTLIGERQQRGGETVYRFEIRLQGEGETVFFDI